jgi:rod shape-determining protein MreC
MSQRLQQDPFIRRRPGDGMDARPRQDGPKLVAFMLVSLALLALSRLDHSVVRAARSLLAEAASPVLSAAMVPFDPVQRALRRFGDLLDMQRELDRLRADGQRLRGWESRAKELERRLVDLDRLAKVVPEPGLTFATVRVIADSTGPFVRTAMVDAGREQGIKHGFPVINADGLVGRVVAAGPRSARLLLLNDFNSRVPVFIGARSLRAVMIGDNSPYPRLAHLPPEEKPQPGDDVFSSGVGGIFPRGLKIGVVVDAGEQLRVELHARLDRLEYVSVLFFETPANALAEDDLSPAERRRRALAGSGAEPSAAGRP